jgi:hypothetical protein
MKIAVSLVLAFALLCSTAPPTYAEPRQIVAGTEIHLTLLSRINSSTAKEGDPFLAVLSQPVQLESRILLPVGTRVHGVIGTIQPAKNFSAFRGQAYLNMTFKSVEIDSRLIPVQMSILLIGSPRVEGESKRRRDMKITEGEVLQEKHDYKGDAIGMAIGGGGGSLVGLIFSNVARGFGIGLASGAVYIAVRKGKEINLPEQTGILARMDSTLSVPQISAANDPLIPMPEANATPSPSATPDSSPSVTPGSTVQ